MWKLILKSYLTKGVLEPVEHGLLRNFFDVKLSRQDHFRGPIVLCSV